MVLEGNVDQIIKSFGFIYDTDGNKYFFHKKNLDNCSIRELEEGDSVEFEAGKDEQNRPVAYRIRKKYKTADSYVEVTPGIHPAFRMDHFNNDEIDIINKLMDVFYMSSGGREFTLGQSTYRFCLAKPTDYYTRNFQLSREIVVIFCDYISFEPRSLGAATYVYDTTREKLRLDRGCHIFICHDDTIEEKLGELLKDSNVNQIIIPFTYRELLESSDFENLIRERFRKYLFDTDLFSVSAPITNELFFFGRRDLVHDIVSKCKNSTNSGVFGLRRSGKTSVLYAVKRLLDQQNYPTVFIPCESDLSSLDWRTALCKVVLDVYDSLELDNSHITEEDYQSPLHTTNYFEEDMNKALADQIYPVTLMFDEIEAITFGVARSNDYSNLWLDGEGFIAFWNTIKGYYSKYPSKISILVAGTNPMINEVPNIGSEPNPMFRQLSESNQGAYLQAFTQEDTKNMVDRLGGYMGLKFDDYTIGKLTSDCGGHPYLMRILCSFINKFMRNQDIQRPALVTQSIYDKAILEFEKDDSATSFFWMILNILIISYPKEFNTLKVLALQGDAIVSQIQDKDALSHLIGYGLVDYNQNNYAIRYSTITRFLRDEYRFERQGLSIGDQRQEINLRISNAENQMRKIVKNVLRSNLGLQKAFSIILAEMENNPSISEKTIEKARQLTYTQLFDASVNNIPLSVLISTILDYPEVFANVFESSASEIRRHLTTINDSRRCPAHSYAENAENWSWDNFESFRQSMSWLESILREYE